MGFAGGHDAFASALAWWADAGVDALIDEAPRNWLARAAPPQEPAAVTAATPALPDTLDAFVAWRSEGADVPEAGWGAPRVAPAGDPGAALMVLVDQPATAALLGEAEGRLFDRMLAAIGLDRSGIYLAPLAWAEPLVRPGGAERARLEALGRHHVALVRPRALLALGDAVSCALAETNLAQARGRLHRFNHEGASVGVVVSHHPRFLLQRPAAKAGSWADLLALKGVLVS